MSAILMSIRPQHVANIMNLIKLLEMRKVFPKDYVGWVYIYCTKDKKIFLRDFRDKKKWAAYWKFVAMGNDPSNVGELPPILNGKVVARFWCDKVENAYNFYTEELCQLACISKEELCKYAGGWYKTDDLLAIHITKVEPFDKPKELKDFSAYSHTISGIGFKGEPKKFKVLKPLARAPQNWCYVEV